ncbi:hypothetical protein HK097_009475, partial [Rhizophlyctis rosea]
MFSTKGQPNIIVIGAGVQGLSVACLLQSRGHKVTIVSHSSPSNPSPNTPTHHFTSPKAGANWFSFAEKDDIRLQEWDALTLQTLKTLSPVPNLGIHKLPCNQYWKNTEDYEKPWYADIDHLKYEKLPTSSLPPSYKKGIKFDTLTINVPVYLSNLSQLFLSLGGTFLPVPTSPPLTHITQTFTITTPPPTLIINCTGLGSRTLGGVEDKDVYPTRGQTVLVKAAVERTVVDFGGRFGGDEVTYVIPRGDGTVILGGTYQPNDWNLTPDPETAMRIITRCTAICPEIVPPGQTSPHILTHDVGLRPSRKGGLRLEVEKFDNGSGELVPVVHNYGHGGYGYQSSWGCAAEVALLAEGQLKGGADGGNINLEDRQGILLEFERML